MKSLMGILLLMLPAIGLATDYSNQQVDQIIQSGEMPDGIVFELITFEDDAWSWAAPMIESLASGLRQKFPEVEIALVSHGSEMFDLATQENRHDQPAIKQLASISESGVDIHVCGGFASYQQLGDDDFLKFVDVAPSAPARLNDYLNLGFELIRLEKPDDAF
ncbi:MAG: intracellular sulfur oxidation DsrE/DsrF family protein [Gammaproteobacteria bacterium]|jgi:intracellular sulfur oxidation DsrE/DsrF family protein